MPENSQSPLIDLPDREKYLLTSRQDVITTLNDLSRKPDLITAYYNHGHESIITTVVEVLPERDLVILECGPDARNNEQLLATGSTTCLSKHNEIDIRFQLTNLRSARYHGEQVFAAPIPESLLRLQRREYFRVHTPVMNPITCRFEGETGSKVQLTLELPLADISIGGLSMIDSTRRFNPEKGVLLEPCMLTFPDDGGEMEVILEVRGVFMHNKNEVQQVRRIGCAYSNLSTDKSSFIQRYINHLQITQKNLTRN
jgi:c-di-GMP-binding flagellar brake protein YcgR